MTLRWYPGTSVTAPLPTNLCPPPAGAAAGPTNRFCPGVHWASSQQGAAQRRPGPRLVLPPVDFYLPPVTEQDQCGSLGGVSPVIVIADVLQ